MSVTLAAGFAGLVVLTLTSLLSDFSTQSARARRPSVYRETWDEIAPLHSNISLRTENDLGLVVNSSYAANKTIAVIDSAFITRESDMVYRMLLAFPNQPEAAFIVALAFERATPSSTFAPLWRIAGLEIPDTRAVRLKGIFAEDIDNEFFDLVTAETSMAGLRTELDTLIKLCMEIGTFFNLEISFPYLRWSLVMIRGFGIRDPSGEILAFAAALVFARHSPHSDTGIFFSAGANLEIVTSRDFQDGDEILIPGSAYVSDAWAFSYRGWMITDGSRARFKFPGSNFQVWLRKEPHIDETVIAAFGFDGSERSRQSSLKKLIKAIEEKIRNFQVCNKKLREKLSAEAIEFSLLKIRDGEASILARNLNEAKRNLEISTQIFPSYPT